jgi:hypothetical protein
MKCSCGSLVGFINRFVIGRLEEYRLLERVYALGSKRKVSDQSTGDQPERFAFFSLQMTGLCLCCLRFVCAYLVDENDLVRK